MEIIFVMFLCILFYLLFIVPTKWLKVERNQTMLGLNKKVLQISDLHMERIRVKPEQIQKVIEKEEPDFIFLTGDYYDKPKSKAKKEKAIEGVSFIGGEPFLQAKSLSSLAKWCWENDLSVLVFTGYTLSEIKAMNMEGSSDLLDHCDLLIDGPYIQSQADDKRPWIGSKNQTVHNLTARYPEGIEYVANRAMEILINDDSILVNGWPWLID